MSLLDDFHAGTRLYGKNVAEICQPMYQYFGINSAAVIEIDRNDRVFNIHTNHEWIDNCLEKEYYKDDPHIISPKNMGNGFTLWSTREEQEYKAGILHDINHNFNMCHGVTYVQSNSYGYKVFAFSAEREHTGVHSKIISSLSLFRKFITYFDEKLNSIRMNLNSRKVLAPELKGNLFYQQKGIIQPFSINASKEQFLQSVDVEFSHLHKIKVSRKEAACLQLLLEGLTAKQMGNKLFISHRTVEKHIENLKRNFKVKTKKELLEIAAKLQVL